MFSSEFCKVFNNTFFYWPLPNDCFCGNFWKIGILNPFHADVRLLYHWKCHKTRGFLKFLGGFRNGMLVWNGLKYSCNFVLLTAASILDPFGTNPTKMVKHTQTVCRLLPTNCLSAFDHFEAFSGFSGKIMFLFCNSRWAFQNTIYRYLNTHLTTFSIV